MIFEMYPLLWLHRELHGGRGYSPAGGGTCGPESKDMGGTQRGGEGDGKGAK